MSEKFPFTAEQYMVKAEHLSDVIAIHAKEIVIHQKEIRRLLELQGRYVAKAAAQEKEKDA